MQVIRSKGWSQTSCHQEKKTKLADYTRKLNGTDTMEQHRITLNWPVYIFFGLPATCHHSSALDS